MSFIIKIAAAMGFVGALVAYGMWVHSVAHQTIVIEGTVSDVEYISPTFGGAAMTVVKFTDGRVVPFRGYSSIVIGKKVTITAQDNYRIISLKINRQTEVNL